MTKSTSNGTLSQLKSLMSQHTAATFPVTAAAAPARTQPQPATIAKMPVAATQPPEAAPPQVKRCTVQLLSNEVEKMDSLFLEVHQRLGARIAISDVLRVGLLRIGPNAPITAEELASLRAADRRRSKMQG